ncbi:hypothetical protein I4F81_008595 [Pyropia yezoensis]|uniref:Uncharacterized protein n=1 Tax=Pyropia yezoensis TaxID=2788 RepID=A0ACC3C7W4_PYRYE|nr:hypothetical protein I4F81_008595 [Neopyropia yezoensis]
MADPPSGLRRRGGTGGDGSGAVGASDGGAPADSVASLRDVIPDMSVDEAGRRLAASAGVVAAALGLLWRLLATAWAVAASGATVAVAALGIGRPDGQDVSAVAAVAELGGGSEEAARFIADYARLVAPTATSAGGGDAPPPSRVPLPPFYAGSYAAALGAARRAYTPLIVYLHAPAHPDVPTFAGHILGHPALAPVLASATLYGADVSHPTGRTLAHALAPSTYPFLAVLLPPASAASAASGARRPGEFTAAVYGARVSAREGAPLLPPTPLTPAGVDATASAVAAYLARALRRAAPPLRAARATATAASTARALRAEQDRAYEETLEADRRREEAAAAAAAAAAAEAAAAAAAADREAAKAAEAAAAAAEAAAARRARLDALGGEPARGTPGACRVRLRLPGGGTADRRFGADEPMGRLWDWVGGVADVDVAEVALVSSFPRRLWRWPEEAGGVVGGDGGLGGGVALMLEARDDAAGGDESEGVVDAAEGE